MKGELSHLNLEQRIFAAVVTQEAARVIVRYSSIEAPSLQPYWHRYLYHGGDFVNGYMIAYFFTTIANFAIDEIVGTQENADRGLVQRAASWLSGHWAAIALTGVALATATVVYAETMPGFGKPDLKDIPAGIAGALTYLGVHCYAMRSGNQT